MCSKTSPPRLSFSHDLSEQQNLPLEQDVPFRDTLLQDSNSEFEFSTSNNLEFESSSADELFSNGVILPFQVQNKTTTTTRKHTHHVTPSSYTKLPPRPSVDKVKKETIRELIDVSSNHEKKPPSKSLWGFSRSKSLNCDTKKSLVCTSPLLSRSNSTGSVSNPKRMSTSNKKQESAIKPSSLSYSCSSSTLNLYPMQKSASGKSYGGSYANGLRISPVLNVPTPCVSKGSANLFGLGSFLRVGKVKKSKK